MADKPDVFCVGDVHGNVERLEALLVKADVDNKECVVVQLGDLGHHGEETRSGDLEAWSRARDGWVDIVLWGNHDRAVVDRHRHGFIGFAGDSPEMLHIMRGMEAEGRLLMAYEAHGWLLTHAGLHAQFKYQKVDIDKKDPAAIAHWINERMRSGEAEAVIDAIGGKRGGWSAYGGILWRDISEKLYPEVKQVFGHSASGKHKVRGEKDKWWCVDIGGKPSRDDPGADCLAGIWLPSQEIVRVDMDNR